MPNYLISQTPEKVVLRNFEGVITSYTQSLHYENKCNCEFCKKEETKYKLTGVAEVASGVKQKRLEPTILERNNRKMGW